MAEASATRYPVTYDVEYPEELSWWLIFVKWLLAIPHFIILFTKSYPRELFNFVVNINRWAANVNAYVLLQRDEYPPFSWDSGQYPVAYEVEYPEELSRWLICVKWLLAIPHFIVLLFLSLGMLVALLLAWFAILFTERYPESLFRYVVGVQRWQLRLGAYVNLLTDEYPPFSLDA